MASVLHRGLRVGDPIGPFIRVGSVANWNRYAAVNDEFVPIHMDGDAGRAAGMSGAFAQGNLQVSYIHTLLREWLGDDGRIVKVAVQFRKPALEGTVKVVGVITAIDRSPGGAEVTVDLAITDGEGNVLTPGSAVVFVDDPDSPRDVAPASTPGQTSAGSDE